MEPVSVGIHRNLCDVAVALASTCFLLRRFSERNHHPSVFDTPPAKGKSLSVMNLLRRIKRYHERSHMIRKHLLTLMALILLSTWAFAQFPVSPACNPSFNGKMICVLPQTFGPNGLVLPNPRHNAHFVSSFQENFAPLTLSVGTELTLLSIASPASGVIFTFDPTLGVVSRSTESYGPILTERAETVGKHKLYVAGTYQFYDFSSLDGIDLKHIPVVFSHAQFPISGTIPLFEHDFITTENRIDLKVHQVTLYGTFGLTSRVDASVAIPIMNVRLAVASNANIVRVQPEPVPPTDPNFGSSVNGFFHYFIPGEPATSTSATFCSGNIDPASCAGRTVTGIGDVLFGVKGTVLKGERARVALGLNVRTPTGDEQNFLGAGAPGVKPFLAASYRARVSPHANIGFEWNGNSILAGNVAKGTTGKLPNQFFYSGGVDLGATKRLTVAADLLGQRLSSTVRIRQTAFVDTQGVSHPDIPQTQLFRNSANIVDLATGVKYNPKGNLLVTANALFKLNDAGLRATVVPLVGISYTF